MRILIILLLSFVIPCYSYAKTLPPIEREKEIKEKYPNIIEKGKFVDKCIKKVVGKKKANNMIVAIEEAFNEPNLTYYKEDSDEIEAVIGKLITEAIKELRDENYKTKIKTKTLKEFKDSIKDIKKWDE